MKRKSSNVKLSFNSECKLSKLLDETIFYDIIIFYFF